jgi:hypothetical protein
VTPRFLFSLLNSCLLSSYPLLFFGFLVLFTVPFIYWYSTLTSCIYTYNKLIPNIICVFLTFLKVTVQAMSIAGQWPGRGRERCVCILVECYRWRNTYFLHHLASLQRNIRRVFSIVEHLQFFYVVYFHIRGCLYCTFHLLVLYINILYLYIYIHTIN